MSLEISLYTKTWTKTGLKKLLSLNNFSKSKHFLDEMNTEEMLHFMWFGIDNYESSAGVEATIIKASIKDKKNYKCSDWILHTRTRSSGTFEDKQKQNEIIRIARKQFGWTFYNDWYGTNKYTNLDDYKKFTPLEKGISLVANNSLEKLSQIYDCLDGYKNELSENIANISHESIKSILISKDPSIILYNSLMPFLVSVLEYFFSQCFENYIRYDEKARYLLADEKIKIEISEVISILNRENSIEQIIRKSYNFQNLESINKAFNKYLWIDVLSVLSKRKKINNKIFRLLPKVQEILSTRHRFVHELEIDYELSKKIYFDYILVVEDTINQIIISFKDKWLSLKVDPIIRPVKSKLPETIWRLP